jgi:hypothetical protein
MPRNLLLDDSESGTPEDRNVIDLSGEGTFNTITIRGLKHADVVEPEVEDFEMHGIDVQYTDGEPCDLNIISPYAHDGFQHGIAVGGYEAGPDTIKGVRIKNARVHDIKAGEGLPSHWATGFGIIFHGAEECVVEDSRVEGCALSGIHADGGPEFLSLNNTFRNNYVGDCGTYAARGVGLMEAEWAPGTIFEGNVLYRSGKPNSAWCAAILISQGSDGCNVDWNFIYGPHNTKALIWIMRASQASRNITIHHNSINASGMCAINSECVPVDVYGNLAEGMAFFLHNDMNVEGATSDYNLAHPNTKWLGPWPQMNLSTWTSKTGQDANSETHSDIFMFGDRPEPMDYARLETPKPFNSIAGSWQPTPPTTTTNPNLETRVEELERKVDELHATSDQNTSAIVDNNTAITEINSDLEECEESYNHLHNEVVELEDIVNKNAEYTLSELSNITERLNEALGDISEELNKISEKIDYIYRWKQQDRDAHNIG